MKHGEFNDIFLFKKIIRIDTAIKNATDRYAKLKEEFTQLLHNCIGQTLENRIKMLQKMTKITHKMLRGLDNINTLEKSRGRAYSLMSDCEDNYCNQKGL